MVTVDVENYGFIEALESRPNSNELSYSTFNETGKIFKYDILTKENKMIFSDQDYQGYFNDFLYRNIKWSPNGKYLSIVGRRTTGSFSTQNLFIDSLNKPIFIEEKWDILYVLDWINNETIVYENLDEGRIYGYSLKEDISKALPVQEHGVSQFPLSFRFTGNYPNPFNPSTTIKIKTRSRQDVSISIYNQLGQLVRLLYNGNLDQGEYSLKWDGKNENGQVQSSGIYFVLCYNRFEMVDRLKINLMK